MKQKILSLLVLLLTAASGAWAQEETLLVTMTAGETVTYAPATATDVAEITMTGATQLGTWEDYYYGNHYSWLNSSWNDTDKGTLEVTAKPGYTITKVVFSGSDIAGGPGSREVTASPFAVYPWGGGSAFGSTVYTSDSYTEIIKSTKSNDILGIDKIEVYGYAGTPAPGIKVTTNAASEGATFTEASFAMPAYDTTAEYELVRDITQKVDVEVRIDGAATERVRIAKDGDGHYKFVTKQENSVQFAAVDKLDNNKDLTNGELTYTFKMKEGNDYVAKNFDTDLCPGTWRLEATANAEKPYEGIAYSKDIVLYQGYEVTVGAGEYATFYKDEALYTEDADAELYTIASVTDTEAVLSDQIKVAPAKTPLLIYNKGEKDMTFILLPTEEQADAITAADQFKGTLVDKDMPASTEGEDYYVCTGKAFVWVMSEGTIAANKCWLEIIAQAAGARANTRSITGGSDTTGIDAATRDDIDGNYYDLQGRKVVKPNSKGIYIHNGKKVIKH